MIRACFFPAKPQKGKKRGGKGTHFSMEIAANWLHLQCISYFYHRFHAHHQGDVVSSVLSGENGGEKCRDPIL